MPKAKPDPVVLAKIRHAKALGEFQKVSLEFHAGSGDIKTVNAKFKKMKKAHEAFMATAKEALER